MKDELLRTLRLGRQKTFDYNAVNFIKKTVEEINLVSRRGALCINLFGDFIDSVLPNFQCSFRTKKVNYLKRCRFLNLVLIKTPGVFEKTDIGDAISSLILEEFENAANDLKMKQNEK